MGILPIAKSIVLSWLYMGILRITLSRVDDMFNAAFDGSSKINQFLMHSLVPLTVVR